MKTHAKTFPTFWTGATARQLAGRGPFAKLIAAYLFTSPAAIAADNYGIYYLERDVVLRHVECAPDELDRNIVLLAQLHVAYYDIETEWVFVREAAAWQYGAPLLPRDFNCSNARRFYRQLPKNPWLGPWFDRYVTDLCLQHDEEDAQWVDRREWTGRTPAIAEFMSLPAPSRPAPRPLVKREAEPKKRMAKATITPKAKPFVERVLHRLRSLKMNGTLGGAVAIAIKQLEQGDVELGAIERKLLDVVIEELGEQIDYEARSTIAPFKSRMKPEEYTRAYVLARDAAARRLANLPAFQEA